MKAGFAIPQVFPDGPVDLDAIRRTAIRCEELGFEDLWTQEQIVGSGRTLEPLNLLSYLAAVTERIRLGVSVIVLPQRDPVLLAKMIGTLDNLSNGRALIGVGLGGTALDPVFGVGERRVRRFTESIRIMDSLWREEATTFDGIFFHLENATMEPKPIQKPRPPLWIGARVEAAVRRAVRYGDGWMGQGSSSTTLFKENAAHVRRFLEEAGRDPAGFAISKRVYIAIDDDAGRAIQRLTDWIDHRYGRPGMAREVSVWGPASSVYEQLDEIVDGGAGHLLLNPVFDYDEQLEALAEYVRERS